MHAEELGLDGVFVPDHVLAKPATTQHYGSHWPDPFSLLAYLAGSTRRPHLGASVILCYPSATRWPRPRRRHRGSGLRRPVHLRDRRRLGRGGVQ